MKIAILLMAILAIASPLAPSLLAKKGNEKKGNTAEDLLRPPKIRNLSISPDGKHVAGIGPLNKGDQYGLVIIDLDTMKTKRSFHWQPGHDIYRKWWMNNDDLAFTVSKWDSFVAGVFGARISESRIRRLIGNDAVVRMVDTIPDDPSSAWIWIRSGWEIKPMLAKLKVTGNATFMEIGNEIALRTKDNHLLSNKILQPPGDVFGWYTDLDSQPRIISRFHDDTLEYLLLSNDKKDEWSPLPLDPEEWDIEVFSADPNVVYIAGYNGEETKGLYSYDLTTNEIGDLLFRDPYYDFSQTARYVIYEKRLIGIRYDRDTPAIVWLASDLEAIQNMIDNALPGRSNIIYDFSDDFSRHLIYSYSDIAPPEYILLDLKKKALTEITKASPWIDYAALAKTEVFHFKTSDGLKLEGYLTRPKGVKAPYPTICLVHGGPWARDYGTYDDETQFFASRGYAVLRVNYRGSIGYGKRISQEPEYDFRKMHDDITEAVNTAVRFGIADPDRLAIMGASFGGYASLCGAAFEPDLYKCAITNMGVFDWEQMIKDRGYQKHRYAKMRLAEELGNPKEDQEHFERISPIYHVDKIKIPIFIVHGKNDKNVSVKHSKKLAAELKKNGVEHETMFVSGEGHNIFDVKQRVKVYENVIDFLEQHMN